MTEVTAERFDNERLNYRRNLPKSMRMGVKYGWFQRCFCNMHYIHDRRYLPEDRTLEIEL